jgi:hypothetical protein
MSLLIKAQSVAILSNTQVSAIENLFARFGRVFHIKSEAERDCEFVFVRASSYAKGGRLSNHFGIGWDKAQRETKGLGFDVLFDFCYKELNERFELIEK